jgi:glycosyltransferase involved in cell wall biosynthesis
VIQKKVLLIGMANSVHTARWIEQFKDLPIEITLIPSTARRSIHPRIQELSKSEQELKLLLPKFFYAISIPVGCLDLVFRGRVMGLFLQMWIRYRNRGFHIVHAMELQHAGYIMLTAISNLSFERTILSNWGSDIYWFQRFKRHRRMLVRLMKIASHYSCECHRDLELAKSLGFNGTYFDVQPNAGPISDRNLSLGAAAQPPSKRKRIMVKGYTGFVGRADLALAAISLCAEELREFEVCIYSADRRCRRIARHLHDQHGINFRVFRKYELSHDEMLQYFRESRLYLGVSMSDGISTSLLESIASGAFPVQTSTSCADEWVTNGVNGFIIDWTKTELIAQALKVALSDDDLVDRAAILNSKVAQDRLSDSSFKKFHIDFYK